MKNYELVAHTSTGVRVVNDSNDVSVLDDIVAVNEGWAYLYGEFCKLQVRRK